MTTSTAPLSRAEVGLLLPCPFCGGVARVEPDPWGGESVRISCGNDACRVAPRTEYLLLRFVDELRAAWNGRHPGTAEGAPGIADTCCGAGEVRA